jgi:hypothetical protein
MIAVSQCKLVFASTIAASLLFGSACYAQKLVDPASVAPEHRAAAEKRRAEQLRLRQCTQKAENEKVKPRDRADFILHCIEAAEASKQ